MKNIFVLSAISILISSCDSEFDNPCFQSSGDRIKETRELPDISAVSVHDIFNIFLIQDTTNRIIIEAGANLTDDIITEVSDGRLRIENKSKCRFLRDYNRVNLYISVSHLKYLWLWQPCQVITVNSLKGSYLRIYSYAKLFEGKLNIDCNKFDFGVNLYCSGSCQINGFAEELVLMNRGSFHIYADELACSKAYVTNNSIGNIYLNATDSLFVDIWLSGNIFYSGHPEIIINEIRSTGQLIKKE